MRRTACLLLALPLALAGCGGDDKKGSAGGGREIAVKASDSLRFDPATITAKPGERVTFVVTNTGAIDHEFAIGDDAYQAEHGKEMASGGGHGGGHGGKAKGGTAVALPPGKTVRVDFTMPDRPPSYACHVAAHDQAGMKGTVTY